MKTYQLNQLHEDLQKALKATPISYPVTFIKDRHKDGSETRQDFIRINENEAVKERTYNYS